MPSAAGGRSGDPPAMMPYGQRELIKGADDGAGSDGVGVVRAGAGADDPLKPMSGGTGRSCCAPEISVTVLG